MKTACRVDKGKSGSPRAETDVSQLQVANMNRGVLGVETDALEVRLLWLELLFLV